MKKLIKFIFGLAAAGVILIIAAVIILPMVVTLDDYKPQIIEAVKRETGRDLVIKGEIGLRVFPKLGLNLGHTSLSNAEGFGEPVFASVQAVNIQIALIPLLGDKIEMDEVVLQGLSLNLQRNKAGKTNWDDLTGGGREPGKINKADGSTDSPPLDSLVVGGIRIEDANILWQDERQDQRYEIKAFNLFTGALSEGDPVNVELKTAFLSTEPDVSGQLQMTMVARMDMGGSRYTLTNLDLNIDARGEALPNGEAITSVTIGQFLLNLQAQTVSLNDLVVKTLGLEVTGGAKGQSIFADSPQFTGRVAINEFDAREVIKALGQPMPVTADAQTLGHVSTSFDWAATASSARLQNINTRLDDTSFTGTFAVTDFERQAINFDLKIDHIDLGRYLPANEQQTDKEDVPRATGEVEAELLPVEVLRQLNASGTVRIGLLKNMNLQATNVVVKIKTEAGKANIQPSATLYGGKYDADIMVDAGTQTPALKMVTSLNGVQAGPLLKDLQGKAVLVGTGNVRLNLTAAGNTLTAVKKTLNGDADFSFKDGALVGVNIAKLLRDGMAKLKGKPISVGDEPNATDFSSLSGTTKITDGVAENRDFSVLSPLLRISGSGKADLVREELDYLLEASVVGSLQGQGGKHLSKLKGLTIPVRITGTFSDPSYKPDLSAALSNVAKRKIKKKVEKKKEAVKDKLKSKLKELF